MKTEQSAMKFLSPKEKILLKQMRKIEVANKSQKERFNERKKHILLILGRPFVRMDLFMCYASMALTRRNGRFNVAGRRLALRQASRWNDPIQRVFRDAAPTAVPTLTEEVKLGLTSPRAHLLHQTTAAQSGRTERDHPHRAREIPDQATDHESHWQTSI
jgi:hypothetical protein